MSTEAGRSPGRTGASRTAGGGTVRQRVGVSFEAGSSEVIRANGVMPVLTRQLYLEAPGQWQPAPHGPLDMRMGTCQKNKSCGLCGCDMVECVGHFGWIDLVLPVFHIGFFRLTINTLSSICKTCSRVLLKEPERQSFSAIVNKPNMSYLRRKGMRDKILKACKKNTTCPHCGAKNGVVKKAPGSVMKIVHAEMVKSLENYGTALKHNNELESIIPKVKHQLLNPLDVEQLFKNIKQEDISLLMVGGKSHPLDLLVRRLCSPPVCIRPSVISDVKAGTTEDDLTMKILDILFINNVIQKHMAHGAKMQQIAEEWDHLQIHCALYINSEISGLPLQMQNKKFTRSLTQRLKGKNGRFRGNLSGKRVDFSGRTVISPDPNLKIDQVGVPELVAKVLTYPERVTKSNKERMQKLICNGADKHPGANFIVQSSTGNKISLKFGNRQKAAASIRLGDLIERHLNDDDIILFNRQPSLHKISIMAHRAKVMPGRTFRFNECVCNPYNADFDGDEMNLHLPQTEEAKAEAAILMGVKSNMITPRSGEPLVAAIQDFITGGYLLTHKDSFFNRTFTMQMITALLDTNDHRLCVHKIRLPIPAILKPNKLWTGKQIFSVLLRPTNDSPIKLNMNAKGKSYDKKSKAFDMAVDDSWVVIRNSELICGSLDKTTLGGGSKHNIFYILLRDFGEDAAAECMWRIARLAPTFLSNRGFSIGIGDVTPGKILLEAKQQLLDEGYDKCLKLIIASKNGTLKAQPGCNEDDTLENVLLKELSEIRDHAGKACLKALSRHNSPLIMALCGSKGSTINISQMIACVGQQSISGKRPPNGFEERSLPHFARNQKTPEAKGFVENSFYSGLTPTEFFFHTMGGREGLVDTAVKTAETGYMQRRLVKCLEDLCSAYDNTVRSSTGEVMQFCYGEDRLDPSCMEEEDGKVLDLPHILSHIKADLGQHNTVGILAPDDMNTLVMSTLEAKTHNCSSEFKSTLTQFMKDTLAIAERVYNLPIVCCIQHENEKTNETCNKCSAKSNYRRLMMQSECLTAEHAVTFIELCAARFTRALTEPGTAVGAVAATSIGEPSTQMTLKTFHFAGVASMNITQGVPRIKEIINAVKKITTPVITAKLVNESSELLARQVKARIERTTLGDITEFIEEVYKTDESFILIKVSMQRIKLLHLEVTLGSIADRIAATKLTVPVRHQQIQCIGKSIIVVHPGDSKKMDRFYAFQYLKKHLLNVVIKGLPSIARCVLHADEQKGETLSLLVEGSDFLKVLGTRGVDAKRTMFNNGIEVATVLGIESARSCIIREILTTMASHGIKLDVRHVMLLADLMTSKGEVLGMTRHGLARMKESVLMLASFEKTTDHLFDAAFYAQEDSVCGVSESIIMGIPMTVGTGIFKLLTKTSPVEFTKRKPIFESIM